ncbi:MAG: LiaF-related protein [Treponemataceae bacterium]
MKKKFLWGIMFIILGGVFVLNALDIVEIEFFFKGWWAILIILLALPDLFENIERGKSIFGNLLWIGVGVVLFFVARGVFEMAMVWKLAIPVMLILIGLQIIFESFSNREIKEKIDKLQVDNVEMENSTVAFSGHNLNYDGKVFTGANFDAVFGAIVCDLQNAIIEKDCVITTSAVFGGIELKFPESVRVEVTSNLIFGGISNKRLQTEQDAPNTVTVYIEATCIFGGLEIK